MFHEHRTDVSGQSPPELEAEYATDLAAIVADHGVDAVVEETGLDRGLVESVASEEIPDELTLAQAAAVQALADGVADADTVHEMACEHLLLGMTTGVLDIDAVTAELPLNLEASPDELKAYGTAGLTRSGDVRLSDPDKHEGSYVYLGIVDPAERSGVVTGWLTHERGNGVVFSSVSGGRVVVDSQLDYGKLRIDEGEMEKTELMAFGYFEDARLGLEKYADTVARIYDISLPEQPVGYCTWYHDRASNQVRIKKLSAFAAEKLAPYGFDVVQIDDGWQDGKKTNGPRKIFIRHRKEGPYPDGMEATAGHIKKQGLTPGLWFMPFAGNHKDNFFKQEWFVKNADGEPFVTDWGGTSLDMTHPDVRDYVRKVVKRITDDWGYGYVKMDGLYTGTALEQVYVNNEYTRDRLGEAVFHDRDKTYMEAYRRGLKLVNEAAAPDTFMLGCNVSQNMRTFGGSFGLVDAMRIGPDTPGSFGGVDYGSRHYFLHRRVWYNDPDCVKVEKKVPYKEARMFASWVAVSGQLYVLSDWLPGLPEKRLELIRRTIPSHTLMARPVDPFRHARPRAWHLADNRGNRPRHVIGLFNWKSEPAEFDYSLEDLGLDPQETYVAFDYWRNRLLGPFQDRLKVKGNALYCGILAVRPVIDRPQLISTSRHVTQGVVDVSGETWNPEEGTLTGTSKVVRDDPYELRIVSGDDWTVEGVDVASGDMPAGMEVELTETGRLTRVTIESPDTRRVRWKVRFARSAGIKKAGPLKLSAFETLPKVGWSIEQSMAGDSATWWSKKEAHLRS